MRKGLAMGDGRWGHMFSCGGSIFDYEKRGGGRERGKTETTANEKKTEDRTSTEPTPTKATYQSTYITCVYCTRELNNCIFLNSCTISFHRISHTCTGVTNHPSQISSVISSSPTQCQVCPPEARPTQYRPSILTSDRQSASFLVVCPYWVCFDLLKSSPTEPQ